MLDSPFTIHVCFPLVTVKPCFVLERVIRAVPQTVRFDKIFNFWTTLVIQIVYILSEKCDQQSTLFKSFSKHFCIHYFYVVKDSNQLLIIQFSTNPRNSMQVYCVPCRLFLRFKSLWRTIENLCREPSKKSQFSNVVFLSFSSISSTIKGILLQKSTELKMEGRRSFTKRQKSSPVT